MLPRQGASMNLPMLEWALFTLFWTWVGAAAAGWL